jgi:hypothetical protein
LFVDRHISLMVRSIFLQRPTAVLCSTCRVMGGAATGPGAGH